MKSVYTYVLSVIVGFVSYLVYKSYVNAFNSIIAKPDKNYDYIIGAGTTGCVLASRLSEDPSVRVLLVEAGDTMGYLTRVPLTATAAQLGPNDWAVKTVPQKYSAFGMWSQTQFIPRGKGLGGSGAINFLLHGFGLPTDYDRWTRLGFRGWSYEDLKPYFVKAFGTVHNEFDSEDCAVDGECPGAKAPMKLKLLTNNELSTIFKLASDLVSKPGISFRRPTATVRLGRRYSSCDAYLKPVLGRKNLHVLLKTQAISIRFVNQTASSLYILQNHRQLDNIFANKEIILAAGTIKTPQILIRSGVGPEDSLKRLKIPPVAVIPTVGKNVHDHMNMPIYVSIQRPISVTLHKVFTLNTVFDYLWNGKGLLSFPPVAGIEFQNRSALVLFSMGTASERLLRDLSNYKPKVFRSTFPFHNETSREGFMFLSTCLQAKSRGLLTVEDLSSRADPVLDPRYLSRGSDVACIIEAIRRAERLLSTKPFRDIGATIHWPRPERCLTFWSSNTIDRKGSKRRQPTQWNNASPPDVFLECIIREVAVPGHHIGGSCSAHTVLDDKLRVRSVSGVRVMDASVLPAPLSLFPNSVLIAMAEKTADIVRGGYN